MGSVKGDVLKFFNKLLDQSIINVSEFVQFVEIIGDFKGSLFLPYTWNNGIVEYWNVDYKSNFLIS